ncbi:MAG: hypothetical protein ACLUKN_02440 [Bacilli bacterium]
MKNDEIIAFASERVPLMTVFEASESDIKEVAPNVFVIKSDGTTVERSYRPAGERHSCTFERLYFSRGNDPQIYAERKALVLRCAPSFLKALAKILGTAYSATFPTRLK